jgi:RHS repeat-associated protein
MNSEKITRAVTMRYIVIAGLLVWCLFSSVVTALAQNTQSSKNKADQNLKSSVRVNPSTLAMEFSLPLVNYPGRGGNSMPIVFNYSSKLWNMQMSNTRSETVPAAPGQQEYHHITYSSIEVSTLFAEKTISGWSSNLKPYRVIYGPEIYNAAGGFLNTNAPGGGPAHRGEICDVIVDGNFYSPTCESGIVHTVMESCWYDDGGGPYGQHIVDSSECIGPINTNGGNYQEVDVVYRLRIEMPDGSTKEFRKDDRVRNCVLDPIACVETSDGTYLSIDGSAMRFESNELQPDNLTRDVLYMPDGSKYIFPVVVPTPDYGRLVDKNGNFSLYDPGNNKWTDTMGREFTDPFPIPSSLSTPGTYPVTLKGINNADLTYQVEWTTLDSSFEDPNTQLKYTGPDACDQLQAHRVDGDSLFQNQAPFYTDVQTIGLVRYISQTRACASGWGLPPNYGIFNPLVMASIALPDGSKYQFKYNDYGEITKIVYPTGGYERFVYSHIPPMGMTALEIYTQGNRGVTKRYVSIDGLTETQEWTYGMFYDETAVYGIRTVAPDGSKNERMLHTSNISSFGFEDPRNGMAKEERSFDTNGVLRSRTLTDWVVLGPLGQTPYGGASRDPRVKRSVSIVFDPNSSSALATMSEIDYDEGGSTDPTYFSHLNAIRKKSYHYALVNKADVDTEQLSWTTISGWFTGKLAAVSETVYSYSPNYRARGIIGLQTEARSLNPTNTGDVLTKSQPVYDEGGVYFIDEGTTTGYETPTGSYANLRANVTTSRTWIKENNTWLQTHTAYDNFGNARKAWDASGDSDPTKFVETKYEHTSQNPYLFAYPTKIISPAPDTSNIHGTNQTSTSETTYDPATGLVLSVKDDFGQITTTEYDSIIRPIKVNPVVVSGVATGPVSQTEYGVPANGQLPENQRFVKVKKQIDANNWDEFTTWFDGLGRTIKTVAKDSEGDVSVETHYDQIGRVDRVANPYRAGETVYWSKTRYDELGRAVETYAPATLADLANAQSLGVTSHGISNVTNYVGTVVTTSDASGRKSRSITNALGQLVRVDEPTAIGGTADSDLGAFGAPAQPTYYKYDPYGNMVQVTQGVQNRCFKYDSLGHLIRINQPEQTTNPNIGLADTYNSSGQWTAAFTYDNLGNVVTATDAKGVVTANTYDRASRVTTRAYYGEPSGQTTPPVNFFYDGTGLGGLPSPNYNKGKLTVVDNTISQTQYKLFDNFGRLKEMEQRTPAGTEAPYQATPRIFKYIYNFGGTLLEEEYPSGRKVKNELETDGDLKRVYGRANAAALEQTYANAFAYTSDGRIEKLKLGNGLWESAKFNNRLQVTELALGHSVDDGSLWKLNYEYGELNTDYSVNIAKNTGNIAKQTVSFAGLTQPFVQTFKYDQLQRLIEARETKNGNQTWKQSLGYDIYGNRNSSTKIIGGNQTNGAPTVSTSTNRFTSSFFTYDANGNLTVDVDPLTSQVRQFVFNGENKQKEVKVNNVTIGKYYYDGEGKRVKKVTDFETTIFIYSNGKLAAEYSTVTPPASPTINYTMTDMQSSPRVLTDKFGGVVSRRDFMPFGEELYADGANRMTSGKYSLTGEDGVRKRFTGYEKDKETNLDFAEARYYNSDHARFTAVDPLVSSGKSSNPQSFNRFVYVMNRPLTYIDPTGMQVATHRGTVWTNPSQTKFNRAPEKGWTKYEGPDKIFVGNGSYWWRVTSSGWTRLGKFEAAPDLQDIQVDVKIPAEIETSPVENGSPQSGVEFMPGNNLSTDDKDSLATTSTEMLSSPRCRQAFMDGGLRNPFSQKIHFGSVNQLTNGSSAESLGLTPEGLSSSQQAYTDYFTSLNAVTASNARQWMGLGGPRTIDQNPRIFVNSSNYFGERLFAFSFRPGLWSAQTNTSHEIQHGAGAPGGKLEGWKTWFNPFNYGRHDLYYTNPNHDNINSACKKP